MEAHGFIVTKSKHSIQLIPKKLNKSFDFDTFNKLNKIDTELWTVFGEYPINHMHSLIKIYFRKSSICVYRLNILVWPQNGKDSVFPMEYLDPVKRLNRATVIKIPPVEKIENISYELCTV